MRLAPARDIIQRMQGTIFDIQRFTIHDGPGIRTTVFFKGCPLSCLWCSNPEGISPRPQLALYPKDCIGLEQCGRCLDACDTDGGSALQTMDGKVAGVDRAACNLCFSCVQVCPNDTLQVFGRVCSVEELMRVIVSDRSYYERSGGGVTLGGSDPLYQWEFARDLLKECRRYGIHTCVESELHCSRDALDAILPFTDLLITDLKHMDPEQHRRRTGHTNTRILAVRPARYAKECCGRRGRRPWRTGA
jgi:pyruvate formate lyase activating enzyme